jgi:hypothetical protein
VIDLLRERQETTGAEHGLTVERLAQAELAGRQHRDEAQRLGEQLRHERDAARRLSDELVDASRYPLPSL